MDATCPLCSSPLTLIENHLGRHCEGLPCSSCGCNARNRFFYHTLARQIAELRRGDARTPLRILEASSYGYRALGEDYISTLRHQRIEILCTDWYQREFRAENKEDLAALSFADAVFDVICHSHVLEHVEDDAAVIAESMRCLKPGGVLLVAVPIQTDFTYAPKDEYHGDNAYVYRRNGWDLVGKLTQSDFLVNVLVPPEHDALQAVSATDPNALVLDNICYAAKFGVNYNRYRYLFHPLCSEVTSKEQGYAEIWGSLEIFVARKPQLLPLPGLTHTASRFSPHRANG